MKTRSVVPLVLALLLSCCAPNSPEKTRAPEPAPAGSFNSITEIDAPTGSNSGEPNLSTGPSGKTYLSWIEKDAGQTSVKFSVKTTEGWSEPRVIAQNYNMFVNWADVPSLLELPGGALAAHWQVSLPDADEGYNVNVAISKDEGKTWSKPVTPHRDGKKGEHGFVSLSAAADKGVSILWLDPRKLKDEEGDVALMQTTIALDGKLGTELEVDPRVCECCQPTAMPVAGGMLAVYRDRSPDEIRDIVITRFDGSKWSEPMTVADDKWMISACPIQGPAISMSGENVVVAWFTAANDKPKVQVALSKDGGKTFGSPVQVDDGNSLGRVDVVSLDSGGAVVTWIENVAGKGEVRAREVTASGEKRAARTVAKTSLGNASGFPKIERSGNELVFAWTDTDGGKVRTAIGKP
jgi:hypothetical protein